MKHQPCWLNRTLACLSVMTVTGLASTVTYALSPMTETELSNTRGQALLSIGYIAPTDANNPMRLISGANNIGYYRVALQAEMNINTNIRSLKLGCDGANGAGCDINIQNLALSGLPSNFDTGLGYIPPTNNNGNPTFSNVGGRAATSAILKNPFFEVAIKNPDSASTREFAGIRFSAQEIQGLLTAGLNNAATPSVNDGIQALSGFLQIASTTGDVKTAATTFGRQNPTYPIDNALSQQIAGTVNISGIWYRGFRSLPNDANTTGITIPSMDNIGFVMPAFQVNGPRRTQAIVEHVTTTLAEIPLAAPSGCSGTVSGTSIPCNTWDNDQLYVQLVNYNNPKYGAADCVSILFVCAVSNAKFKMDVGSKLTGLNMDITFKQSLSMIHNIPLNGTGGYLSLQMMNLLWPDSHIQSVDVNKTELAQMTQSDVAQKGWWMSFAEPVQLGYLEGAVPVSINDVLPQVAKLVTQRLLDDPDIYMNLGNAIQALASTPIPKTLVIPVNDYTLANPAKLTLENLQLQNQTPVANCYAASGLPFC